ncbi:MAG: hypothetical protein SVR94_11410 [Pseudomonadota bacterium]|nr:hypothetical protein [Pseudomonadota bacterium]
MMSETNLNEMLHELALLNAAHQDALEDVEQAENALHALPEYQVLGEKSEQAQKIRDEIAATRKIINGLTVTAYQQTGEKKPAHGVGIRVGKSYIYDQEVAMSYCRSELPQALKLDKRTFEKYVKGVQDVKPLDLVTVEETITPTIASDLSEYLE